MKRLCLFSVLVSVALAGRIVPELEEILAKARPGEMIPVIVHLKEQADLSLLDGATRDQKVVYLKTWADRTQAPLLDYLRSTTATDIKPFWLSNCIALKTTPDAIRTTVAREDVERLTDDLPRLALTSRDMGTVSDVALSRSKRGNKREKNGFATGLPAPSGGTVDGVQWNITRVKADACWVAGFTGRSAVVGLMDTGVEYHSRLPDALWSLEVGWGWHDAVNGYENYYDDNGHGTHVAGIICGDGGIGVAPGAQLVVAKALDRDGNLRASWAHDCFEWFAGLGTDAPRVINSSWSWHRGHDEFWTDCRNLRALGIIPVFAIGNYGPGSASSVTPGDFPNTIGVGATDIGDNVSQLSSRGPAPDAPPWNDPANWLRPDWNLTKPDVAAPGVGILSCALGRGGVISDLGLMSGTSQAAPHVTGCIALMLDKNPNLTCQQVYSILLDSAERPSQGGSYPNNNYGWGRLNCAAALAAVPWLEADMRTLSIRSPLYVTPGTQLTFQADIQNVGRDCQDVPVALFVLDSTVLYEDLDESSGPLVSGESKRMVFSPDWAVPDLPGAYWLYVATGLPGDERPENDSCWRRLHIVSGVFTPPYKENFTKWGPWGWSPPNGWRISACGTEPAPSWNTNDWHRCRYRLSWRACIYSGPGWPAAERTRDSLVSPRLDCSGTGPFFVAYDTYFLDDDGIDEDTAFVLLSTDDGGSWTTLASYRDHVHEARRGHDISRLAAGHSDVRIAFVAHFGELGSTQWMVDDFRISDKVEWCGHEHPLESLPSGPRGRKVKQGGALCVLQDSLIYALKGNNTNEFYVYNIRNNRWSPAETVPSPDKKRVKAGSSLCSDGRRYVYVLKGGTREFWRYDTEHGDTTWQRLSDVPGEKKVKAGSCLAYCDSGLVCLLKGGTKNREWYTFNCATGAWDTTLEPAPPGPKYKKFGKGTSMASDGRNVFVLKGGGTLTGKYSEFHCYLPSRDTWLDLDSLPPLGYFFFTRPKDGAALACDRERRLIYAFYGNGTRSFRTFRYDSDSTLVSGSWTEEHKNPKEMPVIKQGGAAVYVNDTLYVLCGNKTLDFWGIDVGDEWVGRTGSNPAPALRSRGMTAAAMASVVAGWRGKTAFRPDPGVAGPIRVALFDVTGRRLKSSVIAQQEAARTGTATLDADGIVPGVYILRLEADGVRMSRKLVVVK